MGKITRIAAVAMAAGIALSALGRAPSIWQCEALVYTDPTSGAQHPYSVCYESFEGR